MLAFGIISLVLISTLAMPLGTLAMLMSISFWFDEDEKFLALLAPILWFAFFGVPIAYIAMTLGRV